MANPSPLFPASGLSTSVLITSLNPNDVLLGRGTGPAEYGGNRRFRSLVLTRKEEYLDASSRREKNEIAAEIYEHVHALGGRFLKQLEDKKLVDEAGVRRTLWTTAEKNQALEKVKQALREKHKWTADGNTTAAGGQASTQQGFPPVAARSHHGVVSSVPAARVLPGPNLLTPALPSSTMVGMSAPPFLFQGLAAAGLQPQNSMIRPQMLPADPLRAPLIHLPSAHANLDASFVTPAAAASAVQQRLSARSTLVSEETSQACGLRNLLRRLSSSFGSTDSQAVRPANLGQIRDDYRQAKESDDQSSTASTTTSGSSTSRTPSPDSHDTSALDLLSSMADRPRFTEEQAKMEQLTLTDDERADVLCDLFGEHCQVDTHVSKRARKDLDPESVKFLVKQMRVEIDRIPDEKKQALLEAQRKCHPHEFSNERLERFLRTEGMNTKLGAQHFVNYWDARLEVFGPEKYTQRMTLSEALRDDLYALEAGMCHILPHLDSSGRQLVFWLPCRHTGVGYTPESLMRAMWYMIEVVSQENRDISSGIVNVTWDKDSKKWDSGVSDRLAYFARACWPIQFIASHVCCSPSLILRVFKPILFALLDKKIRSRMLFHDDVPDNEIVEVLSTFGIHKEMLPKEMGGTVQLNQAEWIANRRAAELEAL